MKSKEREKLEKSYMKHLHGQLNGNSFSLGKHGHESSQSKNRGYHLMQPKRGRGR